MNVNDKRQSTKNKVEFRELSLGSVYEDEEGIICIKTSYSDDHGEENCIAYKDYGWDAYHQNIHSKVVKIEADLKLRRDE